MKKILYFLLLPIFIIPMVFLHYVHNWKNENSWFESLIDSDNPLKWALFVFSSVIIFPMMAFMLLFWEKWDELLEG